MHGKDFLGFDRLASRPKVMTLDNAIAHNKGKPGIPWVQVKKELGIV
ncbi:MAG TPA: hypothetical protein VNW30_11440 [Opitutaceae bacterium]|jgi:hypothetical protein|nr:hypothetical protein [Opitutaceae bacterium]